LYDPAMGAWAVTGSLATPRKAHTATLLPSGQVLVAGGGNGSALETAELYDSASERWTTTGSLVTARSGATPVLLLDGHVLSAGGRGKNAKLVANAEIYDAELGFRSDWQPKITQAPNNLKSGSRFRLMGSRFQGISQASDENTQDSSSNYPIVQLRRLDNEQVSFLPVDPQRGWSDTSFTSRPVKGFPPGPAQITIFSNGIPSMSNFSITSR
jgi:hypothetical protein